MDNTSGIVFHDVNTRVRLEGDRAVFQRTQYIDDAHLAFLADHRAESTNAPAGDFHLAASIPVVIVEKWMAEGFNIFDKDIGLEAIMKRLRQEDMDRLIATSKSLF